VRFQEAAHFDRFVEIELLMQIDHPVAVGADAVAHLRRRLGDQPDVRSRIEGRTLRRSATSAGGAAGIRKDVAVHPEHAIPCRHCPCCALGKAHRRRFGRRHDTLRKTGRRVELDVFACLAAEQL